jgi:transposase
MAYELGSLDHRIKQLNREFKALGQTNPQVRLLRSVPAIGALNATALVAAVGNASVFAKSGDFAAWLGLVPRQITTGGKARLAGISKRGSIYMRVLLIYGARKDTPLGAWLRTLLQRANAMWRWSHSPTNWLGSRGP